MSQNLGQMIQMLSVLGEMQDRRRQTALDERKLEEQKNQFAEQLKMQGRQAGIQEDDVRFRKLSKVLDQIAEGGASASTAVNDLAPLMGMSPEDAQHFAHLVPNASAAAMQMKTQKEQFDLQNQQAGMAAMSPERRTQVQQESALVGQTQQNSGQYATGQLLSQIAGNGQQQMQNDPNVANRLGQAYNAQLAARQSPDQYATGQAFINGGMAPAAASIAAGITPSAGQMLGYQGNMLDAQMRMLGQSNKPDTLSDETSALSQMRQLAENLANKKYADKNTMNTMMQQYNAFSRLLKGHGVNVPEMTSEADAPSALGRVEMWLRAPFGSQAPVTGSIPGQHPGGGKGNGPGTPIGGMRY